MNHALLGTKYQVGTDGRMISQKHVQVAQMIRDYSERLELVWIPPENRTDGEKPFAVVMNQADGQRYPVFYLDETEMDYGDRILARIWAGDAERNGITDLAAHVEAQELAKKMWEAKQREDEAAERAELVASILKSKKHVYNHNGVRYE